MELARIKILSVVLALCLLIFTFSFSGQIGKFAIDRIALLSDLTDRISTLTPAKPLETHPTVVKGIYVTSWQAGSKSYLAYLDQLFKTTEINTVVVDVKDVSGLVSYKSYQPLVQKYGTYERRIYNIDTLVNWLHSRNIYVIGRIAVFRDNALPGVRPDVALYNVLTKDKLSWKDNTGLTWVDPASTEAQDYNIAIAKDALSHGFDEINFDYIRFPSDGQLKTAGFPFWNGKDSKAAVIKKFFARVREALPNAVLSADLFGQTTVDVKDMGIGQMLEDALTYFDYVCPMVYPSHYANGFIGYEKPAEYPYEVIKYSLDVAQARKKALIALKSTIASTQDTPPVNVGSIRPWIQDFTLGETLYTADMVKSEMKAVSDATHDQFVGYLLWNPLNYYSMEALSVNGK